MVCLESSRVIGIYTQGPPVWPWPQLSELLPSGPACFTPFPSTYPAQLLLERTHGPLFRASHLCIPSVPDLSPLCPIDWLVSFSSTLDCKSFTRVSKFLTVARDTTVVGDCECI